MRCQSLSAITSIAYLLTAGGAFAQQPPAAGLDAAPAQMPFNAPIGAPITLEKAQALIGAAVAEAYKRGWAENVAVVDWRGNLVSFARMDGAKLASLAVAEHKAQTAARSLRPKIVLASRSGIRLVENGKIIGAIGCSGGTGLQDETICQAAVNALAK
jgi:glc operon protein GlcG